ncbi:hypothetical protein HDU67_003733 [Dinochytrium kinnereticum]|nr:hypothetical protein HDU67_003733 [Dinochytrium kinnereticum]
MVRDTCSYCGSPYWSKSSDDRIHWGRLLCDNCEPDKAAHTLTEDGREEDNDDTELIIDDQVDPDDTEDEMEDDEDPRHDSSTAAALREYRQFMARSYRLLRESGTASSEDPGVISSIHPPRVPIDQFHTAVAGGTAPACNCYHQWGCEGTIEVDTGCCGACWENDDGILWGCGGGDGENDAVFDEFGGGVVGPGCIECGTSLDGIGKRFIGFDKFGSDIGICGGCSGGRVGFVDR